MTDPETPPEARPQTIIEGRAVNVTPRPPAPRRRAGLRALFATHLAAGLLGGLIALIAAHYGVAAFRDRLPLLSDRQATDIMARLAQVETGARAAESALVEAQAREAAPAVATRDALEELATRAAAAEQAAQAETAARAATVAELTSRLAAAEQRVEGLARLAGERSVAEAAARRALALTELRRAAESGAPFADAWRMLLAALPGAEAAAPVLAVRSTTGLPTRAGLGAQLAQWRTKAEAAPVGPLAQTLIDAAAGGVVLRRKAPPELAVAEQALARGELNAAIAAVAANAMAEDAAEWLANARDRAAAEAELSQLAGLAPPDAAVEDGG